jgi:hypothetical protein
MLFQKTFIKERGLSIAFPMIFLLYVLLGLSGYGNDCDTYLMLKTGRNLLLTGFYVPSRTPGYLIPEIIIGGSSLLGGFYLSNVISALLGAGTLYLFWRLLRGIFTRSDAILITLSVGLNPYFVIASSSSMDYVYSLFFGIAGITLLRTRKFFIAALAFSLAISARLSNSLIVGVVYAWFLHLRIRDEDANGFVRLILSGGLAIVISMLLFVPSFVACNRTLGFLTYAIGNWTFLGHLSRFLYKNIFLFGLFPFVVLMSSIVWKIIVTRSQLSLSGTGLMALAIVLLHEVLFFKVPLEISYLLPLIFVIVPFWVFVFHPRKVALLALLGLTIVYSFFINIDVLNIKYNASGTEAIAAKIGLFIRPGVVVNDVSRRLSASGSCKLN